MMAQYPIDLTTYPPVELTAGVSQCPTHCDRCQRRAAIILAFEQVGPRPDFVTVNNYVNAVLEVAAWIVGVDQL